jgi:hypothetical protein
MLFHVFRNYYTEKLVTLCKYLVYNPFFSNFTKRFFS